MMCVRECSSKLDLKLAITSNLSDHVLIYKSFIPVVFFFHFGCNKNVQVNAVFNSHSGRRGMKLVRRRRIEQVRKNYVHFSLKLSWLLRLCLANICWGVNIFKQLINVFSLILVQNLCRICRIKMLEWNHPCCRSSTLQTYFMSVFDVVQQWRKDVRSFSVEDTDHFGNGFF